MFEMYIDVACDHEHEEQWRPTQKLAYGEMQYAITLEMKYNLYINNWLSYNKL